MNELDQNFEVLDRALRAPIEDGSYYTGMDRLNNTVHILSAIKRLADLHIDSESEEKDFIATDIKALAESGMNFIGSLLG